MKKTIAIICSLVIVLSSLFIAMGSLVFAASDDLLSASEMNTRLVNTGAYTLSGDTVTSVAGKESKSALFGTQQDFILNFNAEVTANNLQLRIRTKDVSGHSVGYRLFIYSNKISLQKFNDTNWASTEIAAASYDFTKTTAVKIVANGTNLYVELDGVKKLEINNAVDTSAQNGELRFYGMAGAGAGIFKMVSLKDCSSLKAEEDDTPEQTGEVILSASELNTRLVNSSAYTLSGNAVTAVAGKENKSALFGALQDFDLAFKAKVTANNLQLRIRTKDVTGHSVGYRLFIYSNKISLQKFNDTNWASTEIASTSFDFTKMTNVKIVANGTDLYVELDGVKKLEINNAVDTSAQNGELRFYGMSGAGAGVFEMISLTKPVEDTSGDDKEEESGTDIVSASELNTRLINTTAYAQSGNVLKSVSGAKDGKNALFTAQQDFRLGFTVKFAANATNSIQIRIRNKDVSGHSVGYRVILSANKISLQKQNDTNWGATEIKSAACDLAKTSEIVIQAKGTHLFILVDNEKLIEITDAIDTSAQNGELRFYGTTVEGTEVNMLYLKEAVDTPVGDGGNSGGGEDDDDDNQGGDQGGNQGGNEEEITDKLIKALVNSGAYTLNGDVLNNVVGKEAKQATLLEKQNFVFDFKLKINTASAAGDHLQLRIRHADATGHSMGYRLLIYKDRISIQRFNDNNWQSTAIKSVDHDFTKTTTVRIAANGKDLWIALDGIKQIILTDAIDTSENKGALRFYGMNSSATSEFLPVSLEDYDEAKANEGITTPIVDESIIKKASELTNALIRTTAYTLVDGGLVKSVSGLPGKNAIFTDSQDFILDFNMKIDSESFGEYVQLRIRCADLKGHSEGYRIYFYKDRLQLEKFNEDNWNSTRIDSADHDFTKMSKVRIVANGKNLWIAVDNEKLISITDAIDTSANKGELRFYGVQGDSIKAEVEMLSLKKYDAATANDGIKAEDPSKQFEIKSASEILNALIRSGAYVKNGDLANNVAGKDSKNASLTDKQDFIFNFKFKFAEDGSGALQIRLRSKDLQKNSTGYRLFIYKNKIQLEKFKDNAWTSEAIASVKHNFAETSDIRIVAHGEELWVAVNGKRLINISKATQTEGGEIRFYGMNTSALCEVTPVSLLEYNETAAMEGITEAEAQAEDDKAILKPMAQLVSNNTDNEGNSVVLTMVVIFGVVLAVTAVAVVLLLVFKKKK